MALQTVAEIQQEREEARQYEKASTDSYNPQFDFLLQYRNGQTLASVYGRIWRYCQMKRGQCEVSIQRIADEINVSYKTAYRTIDWLCHNGLTYDLTPDAGRHIHTYKINEELHREQTILHNQHRNEPKPKISIF
jgi:hypothetical protein